MITNILWDKIKRETNLICLICQDSLFSFGGTGLDIPKAASTIAKEKVEIICLQALASHSVVCITFLHLSW
jgi:hypothetical protein